MSGNVASTASVNFQNHLNLVVQRSFFAILNGEQPKSLMLSHLMKQKIPDDLQEQRKLLGFSL